MSFRRTVIVACVSLLYLFIPVSGFSESFPEKNLTLIVHSAAGGGYDQYARAVAMQMEKYLPNNQRILVVNKTGGGGVRATTELYNAEPDGYTFGITTPQGFYLMQLVRKVKYDMNNLIWLGKACDDLYAMDVFQGSRFKSVADLKKSDKKIRVGVVGISSPAGIMSILAMEFMGINAEMIGGHKKTSEVFIAGLRGDLDATVATLTGQSASYIRKKKLIPVVQFTKTRHPTLPDVPTSAELGYPDLYKTICTFRAFALPAGVPPERVKILREALWKALNDPELQSWSQKTGKPLDIAPGEETESEVKETLSIYSKYKGVLKKYIE